MKGLFKKSPPFATGTKSREQPSCEEGIVVLVDTLRDGWGERAKADVELAQLLKPYVLVQTIGGIDILRRVD